MEARLGTQFSCPIRAFVVISGNKPEKNKVNVECLRSLAGQVCEVVLKYTGASESLHKGDPGAWRTLVWRVWAEAHDNDNEDD